jgi:polyhydroxyalkanoate synthesis regulator phasin
MANDFAKVTTESGYEDDLAVVSKDFVQNAELSADGDERLTEDLMKRAKEALNDTWVEGITLYEWSQRAADRIAPKD